MKVITIKHKDARGNLWDSYEERWGKTQYHCPMCGEQKVWEEREIKDYRRGVAYICVACKSSVFYLSISGSKSDVDKQRREYLREEG